MPSKSKKSSARPTQVAHPPKVVPTVSVSSQPKREADVPQTQTEKHSHAEIDVDVRTGDTTESAGEPILSNPVNRKKQKRREKEAARRTAEHHHQLVNGHPESAGDVNGQFESIRHGRGPAKGYFTEEPDYVNADYIDADGDADEAFYSNEDDDDDLDYAPEYHEGQERSWLNTSKRKKNSKKNQLQQTGSQSIPASATSRSNLPTLSNAALRSAHKMSNDHIWNTSTQAERENIKQFWLELGEDERRSLVRVEKEAVLRKMKEQQKHSCSCSVCGRKRTAIEEELEVLYDAYYEELEQFANHNNDLSDSPRVMPPPRTYRQLRSPSHPMAGAYPVQGRVRELGEDGEEIEDEDEYEDDEGDDQYSDEDEYDDDLVDGPSDFFQFGNSLTVKDGILTVADDLLKNDGKHFIDMMEQLAERRMQREEEIHYPAPPLAHQNLRQGHNHPPIDEDDDYDDEDEDDDYDSQEEDDFDGDDMDSMTEEQRMEEGRRMFQIFAARMFEQRVLTAYKEKVAAERQKKLLEELDEESRLDTQREAKKAKDAAKKKEKKARQKAAKDEEKAKKEAEKAAQEAAIREAEEKKQAEKRAKQEEQRKKREAERRAVEEERQKKEAEKQQRAQKERERQAEAERKAREAKEREKKVKEQARKKDREEREAKEREARERKAAEDREKREKEEQARKGKHVHAKAEKEAKEKPKTDSSSRPQPVALPSGLHTTSRHPQVQSPNFQVATPVVPPHVPAPGRSRQASQPSQQSHSSSPRSQKASTEALHTSGSPANALPPQTQTINPPKNQRQGPQLHHPQPSAPRSPLSNVGRGSQFPFNGSNPPGLGMNGPPAGAHGVMHGMVPQMPMYHGPPMGHNNRFGPNGIHAPPGFNVPRPYPPGPPMPYQHQHQHPHPQPQPPPTLPPGPPQPQPQQTTPQQPMAKAQPHSRQPSGSENNTQPAPIARPGPIARPPSTTPDKQKPQKLSDSDVDQITTQLGSKALLDDLDEPFVGQLDARANVPPVGVPSTARLPFTSPFQHENPNAFPIGQSGWGNFGGMPPAPGNWGVPGPPRAAPGWNQHSFDPMGGQSNLGRTHGTRPITVRLLLVKACRQLTQMSGSKSDGFHPIQAVLRQVEQLKPAGEPLVSMDEMLAICDTEGNVQNGGGTFEVVVDHNRGGQVVKFMEDVTGPGQGLRGGVGDIGSPISAPGVGMAGHHIGHGGPGQPFGSIGQGTLQNHNQSFGPPGRNF